MASSQGASPCRTGTSDCSGDGRQVFRQSRQISVTGRFDAGSP
jgi:hypothetical protein